MRAPSQSDETAVDALHERLAAWHANPTREFTPLEELLNESRVLIGGVAFPPEHRIHAHHQNVKAALRQQYQAAEAERAAAQSDPPTA